MTDITTSTEADNAGFAALGLAEPLLAVLTALGYEEPTPIQSAAIPLLLAGRDVLGQAATGTGKTAAFALPLIQRVMEGTPRDEDEDARGRRQPGTGGLVLVPTRELAIQVAEAMHRYGRGLGCCVVPVYGGQDIRQQLRALKRGADVVVATPGRALDHIRRGSMALDTVRVVVLDEADEMMDMGFAEDLEAILESVPKERQTALFSATIAPRIASLAGRHLRNPEHIAIGREPVAPGSAPKVRQVAYVVQRQHKVAALGRILDMESPTSAIVFCRTRNEVDTLSETLAARGYRAEALHGGLSQEQRDRVMRRFRDGSSELLIATDVAARGLDIEHVSHVVNFDIPTSPEAYVHRIGRTGRAGREGVAISLAEPREQRQLRIIEQVTKNKIRLETVPTVVDLRTRRLELTRGALQEILTGGDFEEFRVVVEALSDEYDIVDIATAAVKLAHESEEGGVTEDDDIPTVVMREERPSRTRSAGGSDRPARFERDRERPRREDGVESERPRPRREGKGAGGGGGGARLYLGLGRSAGVRPGDLVGAIANESGIDARKIGAIDITDRFSIVEVPEEDVEQVIDALKNATIRGRRVMVRRDRGKDFGDKESKGGGYKGKKKY
ncbi:MAG: ATP-independent helicase [Gemmatimonadetes bacterium]|nr:ATP-independent helicase [Gemmatimonadota bacterium]